MAELNHPVADPPPVNPNLSILGVVWMVWSALSLLGALFIAAIALGFGGLISVLPDSNTGEPAPWWLGLLFGGFGAGIAALLGVFAVAGIAAGIGLRRGRVWAMILACLLGFMQLSSFPLGTALAVATFVVCGMEAGKKRG